MTRRAQPWQRLSGTDLPALIAVLNAKTLLFTVTSGRRGTALPTALLRDCLGIVAEHEPLQVNFVRRSLVLAPEMAATWLAHEELPAMLARAAGPVYAGDVAPGLRGSDRANTGPWPARPSLS